jgi:hypothetical protein
MAVLKVSNFVKLVPEAARTLLPPELRRFKVMLMPWLSQAYYEDKLLHYELVKLPSRYGDNMWEIGLHLESRNQAHNANLLGWFDRHLFEVRDALGDEWCAEPWDRGWTKVYVTFTLDPIDESLVEPTAERLAQAITVLEPMRHVALRIGDRFAE